MIKLLSPKKMLLILGFAFSVNAFATFIDNGSAKKSNPYNNISLKNFSRHSFKNTAYPSFRLSEFQFKGYTDLYQKNSNHSVEGQSFLRMEKGNTTYVYPYKYKIKIPLFKTPSQPQGLR
jgi:hypothetical protein